MKKSNVNTIIIVLLSTLIVLVNIMWVCFIHFKLIPNIKDIYIKDEKEKIQSLENKIKDLEVKIDENLPKE